jgi:arylsulfatase A-like enzyme
MINYCWFVLLGFLLVQWPATAARAENAGRLPKPNILFIMADDHAARAVSAYGSRINRTPNIDRLAREGIRTEDHKLVHFFYADKAWELYDLKNDPNELHNRFADPAYAEVASRLREQLGMLRENLGAESVANTAGQID